jgi:hypothetical protein
MMGENKNVESSRGGLLVSNAQHRMLNENKKETK